MYIGIFLTEEKNVLYLPPSPLPLSPHLFLLLFVSFVCCTNLIYFSFYIIYYSLPSPSSLSPFFAPTDKLRGENQPPGVCATRVKHFKPIFVSRILSYSWASGSLRKWPRGVCWPFSYSILGPCRGSLKLNLIYL